MQGLSLVTAEHDGHEPGVVRMPLDRVPQRQRVRLRGGPGRQGAQQRLGQREQPRDGGQGVARQADEVLVLLGAGQQHGVAGAHLDAVDEEFGADAAQSGVDVVDGAGGGATGGDDDLGVGPRDRVVQRIGVVADPAHGRDLGAQRPQPGRQHGAERVPDEPVVRKALDEQFVSEDEDLGAGRGTAVSVSYPAAAASPRTAGVTCVPTGSS